MGCKIESMCSSYVIAGLLALISIKIGLWLLDIHSIMVLVLMKVKFPKEYVRKTKEKAKVNLESNT